MKILLPVAASVLMLSSCGDPPPRRSVEEEDDWARSAREGRPGRGDNLRIDVQAYEVDERDAEGWSFFWGASVPVGGGGRLSINGLRAGTGGASFFAKLDTWRRRSSVRRKTESFLVTADGAPATLEVGERVAEPVTIVYLEDGRVVDTYRWTTAGALLEVTPKRNADRTVTVKVHPVVSHREGSGRTSLAGLDTVVTVEEGDAVVIGGNETSEDTVGSRLFSRWEGSRRYRLVFVMRVRSW